MTIEETKKAIKIMQAYVDGKDIEIYNKTSNRWDSIPSPNWNCFLECDYRIKPEPRYRPFKNAEEVMEAIKEHGDWVKHDNDIERVFSFNHETVNLTYSNVLYSDAFKMYSFYDGTPFGKLEK